MKLYTHSARINDVLREQKIETSMLVKEIL
jgi:hypothetical protein